MRYVDCLMNLNEYQEQAFALALPQCKTVEYMLMGLANEAGETLGKYKKVLRGDKTLPEAREDLIDESVDALWYISGLLSMLGCTLEEAAQRNLDKLNSRKARGVLQGNGDHR